MPSPGDCGWVARIGVSVVGVVLGLVVCCVFGAVYHNGQAAIWGFVSGVAAALTLYVHVTYWKLKRWYEQNPDRLRTFMYSGCLFQLLGVCGFVVYIVLGIHEQQGLVIYGEGYYLASVWCFMTWKWGFLLFYFSRSYWRRIVLDCLLLPPAEKSTPAEQEGYGSNS